MKYPAWFPFPSCWLKAFLLLTLTGSLIQTVVRFLYGIGNLETAFKQQPEPLTLAFALLLLCPIPLIALSHSLLHRLIGRFSPKLQSPMVQQDSNLMSLWEGLYGWMAIVLGLVAIISLLATFPNVAKSLSTSPEINSFLGLIWLSIVAYLYQVEVLVFRLNNRHLTQRT